MNSCYLKPGIKAEPLIWQWAAWSYLIAPATAAGNIVNRHIKIMQSYIQDPQLHAEAVKNPKLLGGPFIDLDGKHAGKVQDLLQKTKEQCHDLIQLASDLKECDNMLQLESDGSSLEGFYKRVPDGLKGLLELTYDLNHNASMRLIEPLLYQKYYCVDYQHIALSDTKTDFRPFGMSTPRFETTEELHLKIPFSDKRWDTLFEARYVPKPYNELVELFDIPSNKKQLFASFFTETPPKNIKDNKYSGDGIRVRYFGHACVLLETKAVSILIDPVISYEYDTPLTRFTFNDLPETLDYVLLTHNHQDHVLLESLLQLRHKVQHVIFPNNQKGFLPDPSLKLILKHLGFTSLLVCDEMESISIPGGEIMGLPFLGEHADLSIHTKLAYFINLGNRKFIFAADSNNIENNLYQNIFDVIGTIDTLFIGMECDGAPLSWVYGPLLTKPIKRSQDMTRTLSGSNFEKAWEIVKQTKCKQAYVYAMGQEPWLNYIMALNYSEQSIQILESNRFIESCIQNGIESERLYGQKEWIFE